MEYPKIENAFELLREASMNGIEQKYPAEMRSVVRTCLERELDIIKKQGSAAGYMMVLNVLDAVGAKPGEYIARVYINASIVAYSIGLTDVDPVNCDPPIYPELFYGVYGDRLPRFALHVTPKIYDALCSYFKDYPGQDPITLRYDVEGAIYGVIIGDVNGLDYRRLPICDLYSIDFDVFYDLEPKIKELMTDEIIDVCSPKSMADYMKCFGLKYSGEAWKDNAKLILKEKIAPFEDLIATKEDVYEYLCRHGMDRDEARILTYKVGRGASYWQHEIWEAMEKANIPEWYIESCKKIERLLSRTSLISDFNRSTEISKVVKRDRRSDSR